MSILLKRKTGRTSSKVRRGTSSLITFIMLWSLAAPAVLAATDYSGNAAGGSATNVANVLVNDGVVASMTFEQNATVSGFSFPADQTIDKVTIGIIYTRVGAANPHDDQINLNYTVNGVAGATSKIFTPTTGALKTVTQTITADRAWTPDDIANLEVRADPNVLNGVVDANTISIDQLFVRVDANPVASNLAIAPAAPRVNNDLVGSYTYSDLDGDAETTTQIRWLRKRGAGAFQTQVAFNDLLTVPAANLQVNDQWEFTVRPRNAANGLGALVTSDPVTILPANNNPVLDPIGPRTGSENVNADFQLNAVDADGDAVTYSSADLPAGAALTNAGAFTWTPTIGQAGVYNVTFVVTDANDGSDTEVATFTIKSAPTAAFAEVAPANPVGSDDLTATYVYADNDGDGEAGTQIRWFQNGAQVPALDDSLVVPANQTSVGDTWHFTVTPCDTDTSCGNAQTSADVNVGNSIPTAANLAINPGAPIGTDALVGSYDYADGDGDAENGSTIAWFQNGAEVPALANQLNVPADQTNVGDEWYFTVAPSDGTDSGDLQTSATVTVGNTLPVLNPIGDQNGSENNLLTFTLGSSDGDDDGRTYSTADPLPAGATLDPNTGEFTWTPDYTQAGVYNVTFQVNDGRVGGDASEAITITIANTNRDPVLDEIGDQSVNENEELAINPVANDSDLDRPGRTFSLDGMPVGAVYAFNPATGAFTWTPTFDEAGSYVVTLTVTDEDGGVDSETFTITVSNVNRAPAAANLAINPALPVGIDALTGSYDYSDPDGDAEAGSEITWYQNGVAVPALHNQLSVDANLTNVGDEWYFTVTPNDAALLGDLQTSPTVTILNSAPTASNLAVAPADPITNDDLTLSYTFTDGDGDAEVGSQIHWFKDGVQQVALDGETTVPAALTTRGEQWHFDVTPQDARGLAGDLVTSDDVVIGNSNPTLDPIDNQNGAENELLTFTITATDPDGDVLTYSDVGGLPNGATVDANTGVFTWTPDFTQAGEYNVTFLADDGQGGLGVEGITITIANTNRAPSAANLALAPLIPVGTDALAGSYDYSDPDADADVSQIRWYRNNVLVPGLNDQLNVPGDSTSVGDQWKFTVTPCDALGLCGDLQTSPIVVIANTAPVASDVSLTPADPVGTDALLGAYTYSDGDNNAEQNTEIRWYKNGDLQAALNDQLNVTADLTTPTEEWYFTVTPCDNVGLCGELVTSATVTIGNTAPTASDVALAPLSPISTDALTGTYTYADGDSDAEGATQIKWYQNDAEVPALADQLNVPADLTLVGDVWKFTVSACDARGLCADPTESNSVTISNTVPTLNVDNQNGTENVELAFNLTSDDIDNDGVNDVPTYSSANLPEGATLDANTGAFAWTPSFTQAGAYEVTFTVSDGHEGGTDTKTVTITIANSNRVPVLDPVGNRAVDEQTFMNIQLSGTDDDGDSLTYSSSALPDGATFTPAGLFEWTPNADQGTANYPITFTVSDGTDTDSEDIVISVGNVDRPPEFVAIDNQSGSENAELSFTVTAPDPDADAVTVSVGEVPAGVNFVDNGNSSGTFTWTPDYSQAGTYEVTFTATSVTEPALTDTITLTITIANTDRAPVLNEIENQSVNENEALNFVISGSDEDEDALTFSSPNLPEGATLDSETGAFSWTPTYDQSGDYEVTFQVASGEPTLTDSQSIKITVNNVNRDPVLDPIGDKEASALSELQIQLSATDADGNGLTYSFEGDAAGQSLNGETGLFTWTPTVDQVGEHVVTFGVSDGTSSDQETITITVSPSDNRAPSLDPIGDQILTVTGRVTFTVVGNDQDGDVVTLSTSDLPAGATFDPATGFFSFIGQSAGIYTITFTASSGEPVQTDSELVTFNILARTVNASDQGGIGGGAPFPNDAPGATTTVSSSGNGTNGVATVTEPGVVTTPTNPESPTPPSTVAFNPESTPTTNPSSSTSPSPTTPLNPIEVTPTAPAAATGTTDVGGPGTGTSTTTDGTGSASNNAATGPNGTGSTTEPATTNEGNTPTETTPGVSPNQLQASVLGAGDNNGSFDSTDFAISVGVTVLIVAAWYGFRRFRRK